MNADKENSRSVWLVSWEIDDTYAQLIATLGEREARIAVTRLAPSPP